MSEQDYNHFSDPVLNAAGLNLQSVMAVSSITPALQAQLASAGVETDKPLSLILFGNGGPGFWSAFERSRPAAEHPVDTYSRQVVEAFMARRFPGLAFRFLYPGASVVPLQSLGQLAGWHHESPLKVGINDTWGLWYAYRALILVEADLPVSAPVSSQSPCATCHDKPCIVACPAQALSEKNLRLEQCVDFRLQDHSICSHQCMARWACPVAPQHRYAKAQVEYHYGHSLPHLQQWRRKQPTKNSSS